MGETGSQTVLDLQPATLNGGPRPRGVTVTTSFPARSCYARAGLPVRVTVTIGRHAHVRHRLKRWTARTSPMEIVPAEFSVVAPMSPKLVDESLVDRRALERTKCTAAKVPVALGTCVSSHVPAQIRVCASWAPCSPPRRRPELRKRRRCNGDRSDYRRENERDFSQHVVLLKFKADSAACTN
jgi:hypothetical protein